MPITVTNENVERLQEIKEEIKDLIEEASRIIRRGSSTTWERAKGYCIAHITTALDKWWSCACNDRCPKCNKEIGPSETIVHEVKKA